MRRRLDSSARGGEERTVFGSEGTVSILLLWLYWVEFLAGSVALHPSDNSPAWLSIVSTFLWLKMEVSFSNSVSTSARRMSNLQLQSRKPASEARHPLQLTASFIPLLKLFWHVFFMCSGVTLQICINMRPCYFLTHYQIVARCSNQKHSFDVCSRWNFPKWCVWVKLAVTTWPDKSPALCRVPAHMFVRLYTCLCHH